MPRAIRTGAPREEAVELGLHPLGLFAGEFGGGQRRIERAIEHHRSDVVRIQLGVCGTEERAVGQSEEREPFIAERSAHLVKITRHIDRAHMGQDRTGRSSAGLGIIPHRVQERGLGIHGGRDRINGTSRRWVAREPHAGIDPARIHLEARCFVRQ